MADGVVISSMREASEEVIDAKVVDVKSLFDTHVNDGKVIVVVEGPDDMEGMIVAECLPELRGDDAVRCQGINLTDIYAELEDISYLKWFNHANHCGINFSESSLDLDIDVYFNACVANTNNVVSVTLEDMFTFKMAHPGVSEKELCNGHDIFERIYVRAKAANLANYAKKPFFRRLRRAYPRDKFVNTNLFQSIKNWEATNNHTILAVA